MAVNMARFETAPLYAKTSGRVKENNRHAENRIAAQSLAKAVLTGVLSAFMPEPIS
jgi:hypothetical protein